MEIKFHQDTFIRFEEDAFGKAHCQLLIRDPSRSAKIYLDRKNAALLALALVKWIFRK